MTKRKPQSRTPKPAAPHKAGALVFWAVKLPLRLVRWSLRMAGLLLIVGLAALLYLNVAGFPEFLTRRWLAALAEQGYYVRLDGLKFDLLKGVSAINLRLYETPQSQEPLLRAQYLSAGISLIQHLRDQPSPLRLQVRDGCLRLNAQGGSGGVQGERVLALEGVNAQVQIHSSALEIEQLRANFLGVQIQGRGWIAGEARASAAPAVPPENPVVILRQVMARRPEWFPRLVEELNAIRFETPPLASVVFDVDAGKMEHSTARLAATGGLTRVRGVLLSGWSVSAEWKHNEIVLSSAEMRQWKTKASVSASYDLATREAQAHLFSNLPASQWFQLFPRLWTDELLRQGIALNNPLSCEAWLGPAPVDKILDKFSGWVSLEQADLRGLWIEKIFLAFRREGPLVEVQKMEAQLGREAPRRGPLTGRGQYRLDTGCYQGVVRVGCDPGLLLPVLNETQKEVVEWFEFTNSPPAGELAINGVGDDLTTLSIISSNVCATNFVFRGVEVSSFNSMLSISNGVLVLDRAVLIRPEGRVEGLARIWLDDSLVDVQASSTADPMAIAEMIGPEALDFMKQFRIEGPVQATALGRVDYGNSSRTDIGAHIVAEKFGMLWCVTDRAELDFCMTGHRVELSNIVASVYGGTLAGTAAFYPVGRDPDYYYDIQAKGENIDFPRLIQALQQEPNPEKHVGTLAARVQVAGYMGEGRGKTAQGSGWVEVRNGHLLELRLFRELSRFLTFIYPGFVPFAQTECEAEFAIRDARVATQSARLSGSVISMSASGAYNFTGTLDFRAQIQLMRGGPVASVLRLMTFPVTKLLEFRLIGTVADPRWRPVNLPKELFLIFD